MLTRLTLLVALFCVLTGVAAWAQISGLFAGAVPTIDVRDLTSVLQDPATRATRSLPLADATTAQEGESQLLLIDVRSDEETAVSVIPGAITRAEYEANPLRYDNYKLVPYCTVGYRSRQYTEGLLDKGLDAANFEGSIIAWVEAGQPLETLEGISTNRVHTWSARFKVPKGYEQVYE